MNPKSILLAASLIGSSLSPAAVQVEIRNSATDTQFTLPPVPAPATNDAATTAQFTLVDGQRDRNGADLAALHDGRLPSTEDEPSANFFLQSEATGGRLRVDLGKPISIQSVQTYSWHPRARGPQVYRLFAAKGDEKNFDAAPKRPTDPLSAGWQPIAKVDTRSAGRGGQTAVSVADIASLGEFRYLLFDIDPTDGKDPQSQTFFSEIDVVDTAGPLLTTVPKSVISTYPSKDGKYQYVVDAKIAPDLMPWVEKELMPVVEEWYPKLVALLPSDGYTAPTTVKLEFRDDMGGTPAYAAGNKLSMSAPWFRTQLEREAKGCVIHEMVHIVQNYWSARTTNPRPAPTPGWVTEGIPDYIRWFIYEPQSKGAEITKRNFASAKHDSSYRITANFLDWVATTQDKEIIRKLNAAAREGNYSEKLWQDATGKSLDDLAAEWKAGNAKRLGL